MYARRDEAYRLEEVVGLDLDFLMAPWAMVGGAGVVGFAIEVGVKGERYNLFRMGLEARVKVEVVLNGRINFLIYLV